jgi:hypothetical protein
MSFMPSRYIPATTDGMDLLPIPPSGTNDDAGRMVEEGRKKALELEIRKLLSARAAQNMHQLDRYLSSEMRATFTHLRANTISDDEALSQFMAAYSAEQLGILSEQMAELERRAAQTQMRVAESYQPPPPPTPPPPPPPKKRGFLGRGKD